MRSLYALVCLTNSKDAINTSCILTCSQGLLYKDNDACVSILVGISYVSEQPKPAECCIIVCDVVFLFTLNLHMIDDSIVFSIIP